MKLLFLFFWSIILSPKPGEVTFYDDPLIVRKCLDFNVNGKGDNSEWKKSEWNLLSKVGPGSLDYASKFKILYSATGIYLLFHGVDKKITTQFHEDFEPLYQGDVFEAFFHTDPQVPLYFEYEINHLNKELVLMIPNIKGKFYGWLPWDYKKGRRVTKMVDIVGGKMESNSSITSWSAELFFPYDLLKPLANVPPARGTKWNANFYRLDYDGGEQNKWAWAPVEKSFHEVEKFRQVEFE